MWRYFKYVGKFEKAYLYHTVFHVWFCGMCVLTTLWHHHSVVRTHVPFLHSKHSVVMTQTQCGNDTLCTTVCFTMWKNCDCSIRAYSTFWVPWWVYRLFWSLIENFYRSCCIPWPRKPWYRHQNYSCTMHSKGVMAILMYWRPSWTPSWKLRFSRCGILGDF